MKIAVAWVFIVAISSCITEPPSRCHKQPLNIDIELTATNTVTISWEKGSANDPDALYATIWRSKFDYNVGLQFSSTPIESYYNERGYTYDLDEIYRLDFAVGQYIDSDLLPLTEYTYSTYFAYEDQAIEKEVSDCHLQDTNITTGGTTNTQGVFLPNNPFDN